MMDRRSIIPGQAVVPNYIQGSGNNSRSLSSTSSSERSNFSRSLSSQGSKSLRETEDSKNTQLASQRTTSRNDHSGSGSYSLQESKEESDNTIRVDSLMDESLSSSRSFDFIHKTPKNFAVSKFTTPQPMTSRAPSSTQPEVDFRPQPQPHLAVPGISPQNRHITQSFQTRSVQTKSSSPDTKDLMWSSSEEERSKKERSLPSTKSIPESKIVAVSEDKIRSLLVVLRKYSDRRIKDLPNEGIAAFQDLKRLLNNDAASYGEILIKQIKEVFRDIKPVGKHTIGDLMKGCDVETNFKGPAGCTAECAGSFLFSDSIKPCEYFVGVCVGEDSEIQLTHSPSSNSDTIIIHTYNSEKLTISEGLVEQFQSLGITHYIVSYKDESDYVKRSKRMPIQSSVKKTSNIASTIAGLPPKRKTKALKTKESKKKNEPWSPWLIILVIIVVMIVVIIMVVCWSYWNGSRQVEHKAPVHGNTLGEYYNHM